MILCKRSIQNLEGDDLPAALRHAVDRVMLIGDFSWSAVASRRSVPVAMAIGRSRTAALHRLEEKVLAAGPPTGAPAHAAAGLRSSGVPVPPVPTD